MDDLVGFVLVIVALVLLALLTIALLALRRLARRYLELRVARIEGNIKVTIPMKDWDEAVKNGAFALGVTDAKTGQVVATIIAEKEKEVRKP